jgi:hypothetical protein
LGFELSRQHGDRQWGLFPRRAVDRFLGFVGDLLDGFFDFAFGLIDLAFGAQAIVIGQRPGRFFYASLDLICFSAHDEAPYLNRCGNFKITIGYKGKWRANEIIWRKLVGLCLNLHANSRCPMAPAAKLGCASGGHDMRSEVGRRISRAV